MHQLFLRIGQLLNWLNFASSEEENQDRIFKISHREYILRIFIMQLGYKLGMLNQELIFISR